MNRQATAGRLGDLLARIHWVRLLALSSFSFAITLTGASFESAIFSHKVLRLAPDNPNTLLGLSTFAASALAIFLGPLVGVLSDRTRSSLGRRKPFLIAGVCVLIMSFLVIALAPTILAFVLGVLLYRLGDSLVYTPWQALYPDHVSQEQRGHGAGFKGILDVFGLIIGRFTAGELLSSYPDLGVSTLYAAITVPALGLLIALGVTLWALRDMPTTHPTVESLNLRDSLMKSFTFRARKHPSFVTWFINRALFWTAFIMITQFLLLFVIDVVGFVEADAQRFLSHLFVIIGGIMLLVAVPSGKLTDRIGRKPLILVGCILAAAGATLIVFARDLSVLTIAGIFFSLGSGTFISSSFALATDIVPPAEAGRYLGIANIASAGGAAIARLLGGAIIDPINQLSNSSTAGYLTLYSIAALLFLSSFLIAFKLPGWKKRAITGENL